MVELEGAIDESSSILCWWVFLVVVVDEEEDEDGEEVVSMLEPEFIEEPEPILEPEPIDDEPDGVDELLEVCAKAVPVTRAATTASIKNFFIRTSVKNS